MEEVNIMMKPVSGNCNMRCSYCFYMDEMQNREIRFPAKMSLHTLAQIVKLVQETGVKKCNFAFQGGEPTLVGLAFFEKFISYVKKYLYDRQVSFSIQTNGYNLTDEWMRFLKYNDFLVGVSVDGVRATHDCNRKDTNQRGTYERVMQNIDRLKEAKIPFNVLTVVNAKTAAKIRRIYESYKKNQFRYQQYIICLDPLDSDEKNSSYSLTNEAYGQFLCDLFDLWYLDLQKGEQPYIRQFESYISIFFGMYPDACEQRGVCSCQIVIESDGSVYPCDFYVLDNYSIGNVTDEGFTYEKLPEKAKEFIAPSVAVSTISYAATAAGE